MATVDSNPETFADLLERLGDVPPNRIRLRPPPGTATEQDVVAASLGVNGRLCELVEGVLVEKAMGTREALLASILGQLLWNFVQPRRLGIVLGADGMLRLMPGLVRIPDVSFIARSRLSGGKLPEEAIATLVPDLAVEVLSENNTKGEIQRKLREYFLHGTSLVWVIQPKTQTALAYTSPTDKRRVGKTQTLDGGSVLKEFSVSLQELFARTCLEDEAN